MADTRAGGERPLSPHLQVYRLTLTMFLSIVHRLTGGALYLGTALLAWWLIAAASGPEAYSVVQDFMGSFIGRLVLFGYTWALIHHMLGGIRHLVWDTGHGFDLVTVEIVARATFAASIVLTLAVWVTGYAVMGG